MANNKTACIALTLVSILLTCSCVKAQDVTNATNTGYPENAIIHGTEIESVQVTNGDLHVQIPIWSVKGRGLSTEGMLVYDNKEWFFNNQCFSSGICVNTVTAEPGNNMVLTAHGPLDYTLSYKRSTTSCGGPTTFLTINVVLREPNGTKHHFVPDPVAYSGENPCGNSVAAALYANDGSGWMVKLDSQANPLYSVSKNGTIVPYSSGSFEDSNGNELTSSTDTLGRTIYSGGLTYVDSSGVQRAATIGSTTSVNVATQMCTFSTADQCTEHTATWTVPSVVTLPNGMQYSFGYAQNQGAEITSITLPTTGQITYTYGAWQMGGRTVATRTVTSSGVTGTWTYTITGGTTAPLTIVTDPNSNDATYDCSAAIFDDPCFTKNVKDYSGSYTSGTLLKSELTDYSSIVIGSLISNYITVPIRVTTTWNQVNQVTKTETDWDTATVAGGTTTWKNPLETREFPYGTGAPGTTLARRVHYNYLHLQNSSYLTANIANRQTSKVVYDGSGNIFAQTTTTYDGSSLTATSGVPNHDYTNFSSSNLIRGNPTSVSHWLNPGNTWLNTVNSYDDLGNLLSTTDPLQKTTHYMYDDNWANSSCVPSGVNTHGYVTKTVNALNQSRQSSFYPCTGLVASQKDQNDVNAGRAGTTYTYDLMGRLTQKNLPDGGQVSMSYNDVAPVSFMTTTKIDPSTNMTSTTTLEGLGRVQQTKLTSDSDCPSGDKTDTTYDALGRVASVSNPYCTTSDQTYGVTNYAYDPLGRTSQVTRPDNSTMLTTYTGRAVQVQDEGNGSQRVTRISQSDALGHVTSVCEVSSASLIGSGGTPSACGLDIAGTGFLTTYQYNPLDNLLQVNQSGVGARTFAYDSLSRLTGANNPESNSVTYTYDADSNVITKTDARGITTCFGDWTGSSCNGATGYDALNRLQKKTYSDGTPAAIFNYDQTSALGVTLTNTIGRKSSESTAGSLPTGSVFSYDPMGRFKDNSQCTPQNCGTSVFAIQYTQYDFLGNLLSGTNAVGVTFSYAYDTAGRLTGISSNYVDSSHPGTLFSQATYNSPGLLKTVLLGNGLTETRNHNSRLQLTSLTAGTAYSLSMGSYAPNGDVLAANDSVNGNWVYKYDDFNRLICSNLASNGTCSAPTSGTATYTYKYDRFGNRWQQNGPQSMQLTFTGNNPSNPQNNNRMDGYSYDAAGNLLNDGAHSYSYDAESRLIKVDNGSTASYVYDAEGRRVRKATASGTLDFLYDAEGHKVAEVDPTGTFLRGELFAAGRHFAVFAPDPGPNGATFFIHADWLGTERTRTNMTGTACETIKSLPFGDGQTISDSCGDSAGDVSPMHFTGKERDAESGLDHFQFRKFSSAMGRFMSPDPAGMMAVDIESPQTLNRYSYVLNNPLAFTDPFGLDCAYLNSSGTGLDKNGIDQKSSSAECGKTGGYWVEGTITQVNIDSNATTISLTGTTNGTNQTSASYQQDAVVTVGEYNNTSNNPYNHIALGLAGQTQFGQNPRSDARFLWALSMHGPTASVPGAIKPQVGGRLLGTVRIRATGMQAQMLQNAMNQSAQNPPPYTIFGQTGCDCGTWAQMMLGDAGINAGPPAPLPDVLMQQLNQLYSQQQQPPQ